VDIFAEKASKISLNGLHKPGRLAMTLIRDQHAKEATY
jgi:hypothetical protein